MKFEQAFRLCSYALLLCGFLVLAVSGGVTPLLALVYVPLVLWSWKRERSRPQEKPARRAGYPLLLQASSSHTASRQGSGRLQLLIALISLLFFTIDLIFLSGFVDSTIHLLILLSAFKFLGVKTDRDYLLLYFISFAFLLIASTYALSAFFLAGLLLYAFLAILSFILFESRRAFAENRVARFSLKSYAAVSFLICLLILLISIPIFITIPRSSLGLFGNQKRRALPMTGFSNSVNLGDMGKIIRNSDIVMRVAVDVSVETLPLETKWKGIVLDRYNGKSWSNTLTEYQRVEAAPRGFLVGQNRRQEEFQVKQTIFLESFSNVIFGAPEIIMISSSVSPRDFILKDGNGSLSTFRRGGELLRYVVFSDLMSRNEKLALYTGGSIADSIRQVYLQLPELHPAVARLARQISRGQQSPLGRALIIEDFLRRNYSYSLENASASAEDPLYDFLFVSKSGHCEYFATAQAVIMRSLGIPARVVNGFRMGQYNDWSDYFIVRQSDAHSWAEGYFPGTGWVEFDPTPSAPDRSYALLLASEVLDTIDLFWTEIVTFDRLKQIDFFQGLASTMRRTSDIASVWMQRLKDIDANDWRRSAQHYLAQYWAEGAVASILSTLFLLGWRYRRMLRMSIKKRVLGFEGTQLAPEYYREALEVLKKKGFSRRPYETPYEFAVRVNMWIPDPALVRLTDLYYQNRFGNAPLRDKEVSEIHHLLKRLKQWRRGNTN
ncbi:MAG: DUF3488 domain-containing protein [Acidobacteria bacterium]|nr:DUF3488 domain-containing protein [Acidobacteriota bacterium]